MLFQPPVLLYTFCNRPMMDIEAVFVSGGGIAPRETPGGAASYTIKPFRPDSLGVDYMFRLLFILLYVLTILSVIFFERKQPNEALMWVLIVSCVPYAGLIFLSGVRQHLCDQDDPVLPKQKTA